MRNTILNLVGFTLTAFMLLSSCGVQCVDEVLLQTTKMNMEVNAENLGVSVSAPHNVQDTIRSESHQFYNYPQFRRFGYRYCPQPKNLFVTSAFAQSDCPEQIDYISRMDADKTIFSINKDYDASSVGLGVLAAGSDLLQVNEVNQAYLGDFSSNIFLNGGAPSPLTISKNFFQPINHQWVTFYFLFTEIDGTEFMDSTIAYVDIAF